MAGGGGVPPDPARLCGPGESGSAGPDAPGGRAADRFRPDPRAAGTMPGAELRRGLLQHRRRGGDRDPGPLVRGGGTGGIGPKARNTQQSSPNNMGKEKQRGREHAKLSRPRCLRYDPRFKALPAKCPQHAQRKRQAASACRFILSGGPPVPVVRIRSAGGPGRFPSACRGPVPRGGVPTLRCPGCSGSSGTPPRYGSGCIGDGSGPAPAFSAASP